MESKLTNNEKNFMRNCLRKFPQFFDWDMVQAVDFCLYAWPDERCVAFENFKKAKVICIILTTMQEDAITQIHNLKELYYMYEKGYKTKQDVTAYQLYIEKLMYDGHAY